MEKRLIYGGLCELFLIHPALTLSGHSQGLSLPDPGACALARALRWWPSDGDKPPPEADAGPVPTNLKDICWFSCQMRVSLRKHLASPSGGKCVCKLLGTRVPGVQ